MNNGKYFENIDVDLRIFSAIRKNCELNLVMNYVKSSMMYLVGSVLFFGLFRVSRTLTLNEFIVGLFGLMFGISILTAGGLLLDLDLRMRLRDFINDPFKQIHTLFALHVPVFGFFVILACLLMPSFNVETDEVPLKMRNIAMIVGIYLVSYIVFGGLVFLN